MWRGATRSTDLGRVVVQSCCGAAVGRTGHLLGGRAQLADDLSGEQAAHAVSLCGVGVCHAGGGGVRGRGAGGRRQRRSVDALVLEVVRRVSALQAALLLLLLVVLGCGDAVRQFSVTQWRCRRRRRAGTVDAVVDQTELDVRSRPLALDTLNLHHSKKVNVLSVTR